MKSISLYITFIFLISSGLLHGQCLTNGDFSQDGSCANDNYTCGIFGKNDTCNGWKKIQGTPQILSYTYTPPKSGVPITSYCAYLWGTSNLGEGMATPFTFQNHHSYDVRLLFIGSGHDGGVVVKAANGLTALPYPPQNACGDAVPTANITSQSIGEYDGVSNDEIDKTFSFTANDNYSQLWVYAVGTSSDVNSKYNLNLFQIYACPSCTQVLVYNSGTIPAGESAAGTIQAGSAAGTGGSGTVGNQASQATTLTAANEIDLLPSFQTSITGSGSFTATIVPCNTANTVTIESNPQDSSTITIPTEPVENTTLNRPGTGQSSVLTSNTPLQIYPTAGPGIITITGSPNNLENADITVSDEVGRNVYKSHNAENTTINLDLSNLKNGLYFLQIRQGIKIINQKIIVYK